MLWIDYLLATALVALLVSWWHFAHPYRWQMVVASAIGAAVAGAVAVQDDRWQAVVALIVVAIVLVCMAYTRLRGNTTRHKRPWITGTLLGFGCTLAILFLYWFPAPDLPQPNGQHPVGVRDFMLTDESRPGLLAAPATQGRRLLVRVWYPAGDTQGLVRRPYFSEPEVDTTAAGPGALFGFPGFFKYLKHVGTNSFIDAPLLPDAANLPVVFYSHGYTTFAGQNTVLMEHLASHGYVVYSIQHTYDASPTVFPDGSVAEMDPALLEDMRNQASEGVTDDVKDAFAGATFDIRHAAQLKNMRTAIEKNQRIFAISAEIWLHDRLFVHDALEKNEVPASVTDVAIAGNLLATGQMGMSFGGSTAGGVCMVDIRCRAGINLDGGVFHTSFNATMPVPFLMFYSDYRKLAEQVSGAEVTEAHGFNDFSYERHETAGLREDVLRLTVLDVAHIGISDFTLFMRGPVKAQLLGAIDAGAVIQIQNDFVLGFFDTYLRDLAVDFPNAQFREHADWVERDEVHDVRDWWLTSHPEDQTVRIVLETRMGDVEIALYPERAPISAANFLRYIDAGHYNGSAIYRVAKVGGSSSIGVVQGGLLGDAMAGSGDAYADPEFRYPPIAHEPTTATGIPNQRGVVAYARLAPGSAGSEFFINMVDNPELDTGQGTPERDGHGYATFGRVLRGMPVLHAIEQLPAEGETQPIKIIRAYRVEAR